MRYSLFALAAASTALASPHGHHMHRRAHANIFARNAPAPAPEECVCTTYVTSRVYAVTVPVAVPTASEAVPTAYDSVPAVSEAVPSPSEAVVTLVPVYESDADATTTVSVPEVVYETSSAEVDMPSSAPAPPPASTPVAVPEVPAPTPEASTFTQPGTYTIPAHTLTISSTVTTCVAEETTLHPGDNTYGGITTEVPAPTTLTVPYATIETIDDTTTSVVKSTVYVCPTPGTYTVGASTTSVSVDTPATVLVPTEYAPGTYTQPEQIVTITKTSQVVVCPYETEAPSSSAPVVSAVPTPEAPKPETPKPEAPKPEAPKPETPKPEAPAPEAPAPEHESGSEEEEVPEPEVEAPEVETPEPSPKPETPKPTTPKPSGDGPWSISYSPYEDNGDCRSSSGVMEDIADIASKGFKNVRVYGTECDTLPNVGAACEAAGIKMIVGVFIKGDLSSGDQQVEDIINWGKWNLVELISIGNEAIFNGYTDGTGLAGYINSKKAAIKAAGYTGSFTTAETLGVYQSGGVAEALCSCIDVVGVNIQVFFDGQRTAEEAGEFFGSQYADSQKICPGKDVYVLEAGWPTAGAPIGNAIPGKTQQEVAIKGMNEVAPGHVSFFTYKNDYWKAPADSIEANFGCADLF